MSSWYDYDPSTLQGDLENNIIEGPSPGLVRAAEGDLSLLLPLAGLTSHAQEVV
jgi:hypothetical protein